MDIIQRIKNIAHEASEGYLLFNTPMNATIIQSKIDNHEMLKRICEQANQNVYLSKFQDASGRGNITFDIADFDSIKKNIDESEKSMELYDAPPEDFRSSLEAVVDAMAEPQEKIAGWCKDDTYALTQYRQQFARLANAVGMMKTASIDEMESGFNLIYHNAKRMAANGESLGDMAKIAARCVQEGGLNPNGVMKAYGIIEKELVNSGFNVNTEFTKISSLKINHSAMALRPVKEMTIAIEKIAALSEMEKNVNAIVEAIDRLVKKNV